MKRKILKALLKTLAGLISDFESLKFLLNWPTPSTAGEQSQPSHSAFSLVAPPTDSSHADPTHLLSCPMHAAMPISQMDMENFRALLASCGTLSSLWKRIREEQ